MKNSRVFFLSEKFQFLEMKFSIYLNRRVFVMGLTTCQSVRVIHIKMVYFLCLVLKLLKR